MKKEAVNTFAGGLNYDLNPITTPNSVLTECINGTFITFNGDELALQNDAGNTTIDYNGTPVQLNPGFYPLGIKEYGGVLYIVSGKTPTVTLWESKAYSIGDFVYDENKIYYKCLTSGTYSLPSYSNVNWEYLSSWNEFANKYGQIEFGSYPSPQILTESGKGDGDIYRIENIILEVDPFKNALYKSTIINKNVFKAGEYITFSGISGNLSNITHTLDTVRRIYKVKLYLQLTNGFIDLTKDVWDEYKRSKPGLTTSDYWFNDSSFKYYCKSNFKGKLVIVVELEDLEIYNLNYYEVSKTDLDLNFTIKFNISFVNKTTWPITELKLTYKLDEVPYQQIFTITNTEENQTTDYNLVIDFSTNEGKLFEFEIIPKFLNGINDVTTDLPTEYINKYTLSGSEILGLSFNYDVVNEGEYDGTYYY